MKVKISCYYLIAFAAFYLAGCSGSDNAAPSETITGVFIDGPAIGVKYVFGSYSGLTGAGGTFACQPGTTGRFKIGNLTLGQSECASVITQVDLSKYDNPLLSSAQAQTAALPLVRFLMSVGTISGDGSLAIPETVSLLAIGQSTNLMSVDISTLHSIAQTITSNPSLAFVDAASASNHMLNSLSNIDQYKHAGEYVSSSWHNDTVAHFHVKPNGELSGYLVVSYGYAYEMIGTIISSGTLSLSIKDPVTQQPVPSSTSSGVSNGIGTLTGTTYASPNEHFQYVLKRVTPTTDRYYGVFKGTLTGNSSSTGTCWFGIDFDGKLFGFEYGLASTSSLSLTGEVNMTNGLITLRTAPGSYDNITITGTIGVDGSINNGTWQDSTATGTFSGAKMPIY